MISSTKELQEEKQERIMDEMEARKYKSYTWKEIRKHDKPHDCWVVYEGRVYDVTKFLPHHPGGNALLWMGGGRDITINFNISHPPRVTEADHLQKHGEYMGEVQDGEQEIEGAPEYDWQSPFWCEIKEKGWAKLFDLVRDKPGYKEGHFAAVTYDEWDVRLYTSIMLVLYLLSFAYALWTPLFITPPASFFTDWISWSRILVTIFIVNPTSVAVSLTMHEARHRGDGFLWYFGMDLSAVSSLRYMSDHTWHHNWPNFEDDQIERDLFAYAPLMRHFDWQEHKPWHSFQWLYWPMSLALIIPFKVLTDVTHFWLLGRMGKYRRGYTTWTETALFFVGKGLVLGGFFFPLIYCQFLAPTAEGILYLQPWIGQTLILIIIASGSSFWISILNVPSHLTEDELPESGKQYSDFARTQIAHSRTYGGNSTFWLWATQGVNTQVEHHLFPTVPFKYLPELTPIISEVCSKHNIHIEDPNTTFKDAFGSYLRRVHRLSKKNYVNKKIDDEDTDELDEMEK